MLPGRKKRAQMIVVPGDEPLAEYIGLYNLGDEEIGLLDGEILVTQNAANVLGLRPAIGGDSGSWI